MEQAGTKEEFMKQLVENAREKRQEMIKENEVQQQIDGKLKAIQAQEGDFDYDQIKLLQIDADAGLDQKDRQTLTMHGGNEAERSASSSLQQHLLAS